MGFDDLAQVYDILADPESRLDREGPFLVRWAGGGARVLDLACGTGAHAAYLARAGCRVTACDLSAGMIARAMQERSHPGVRHEVRDLRRPPDGPFDRVLVIGNSLNLLPSRNEVTAALASIRRVLAPGGRLLLQVLNPRARVHREPRIVVRRGEIDGREAVVVKSLVPGDGCRFLSVTCFEKAAAPAGAAGDAAPPWTGRSIEEVLLDLDDAFLRRALAESGFAPVEVLGGMDGSPFVREASPDIVADAFAPEAGAGPAVEG